jgi:predicted DNA-binding transcriptional regulator YafY
MKIMISPEELHGVRAEPIRLNGALTIMRTAAPRWSKCRKIPSKRQPGDRTHRDRFRALRRGRRPWKPTKVSLRLRGPAAARMRDWFAKPEQKRDGSLVVHFKDHITDWLAAWVLRQWEGVEVVAPVALREWVGRLARRVVEGHEG